MSYIYVVTEVYIDEGEDCLVEDIRGVFTDEDLAKKFARNITKEELVKEERRKSRLSYNGRRNFQYCNIAKLTANVGLSKGEHSEFIDF